jgi:hypothetical protein
MTAVYICTVHRSNKNYEIKHREKFYDLYSKKILIVVGYDVLTAVIMKSTTFCYMMSCITKKFSGVPEQNINSILRIGK